jgi:hypothetical protein
MARNIKKLFSSRKIQISKFELNNSIGGNVPDAIIKKGIQAATESAYVTGNLTEESECQYVICNITLLKKK